MTPLLPGRVRDLSFWHYQVTGWLCMAVLRTSVNIASLGHWDEKVILRVLLEVFLGFLLTSLLRYVYRATRGRNLSLFSLTILIGVCSFIVAVATVGLWLVFAQMMGGVKMSPDSKFALWLLSSVAYSFPDKLAWSGLYFGITFWRSWEDERERTEQAAEEAQRAQLQVLRYRLSPRFLFDALTSARALVDEDTRAARQVVTELSEFLRYSLVNRDKPFVLLKEELEAVRLYLSIEQRKYGKKLEIRFDVRDETRELKVPSLLICPVVEHALQFPLRTSEENLILQVGAEAIGDTLEITVSYSGNEPEKTSRDGLLAVNKRLEETFPGQACLVKEQGEGETSLRMRLPLILGDQLEPEIASDHR